MELRISVLVQEEPETDSSFMSAECVFELEFFHSPTLCYAYKGNDISNGSFQMKIFMCYAMHCK